MNYTDFLWTKLAEECAEVAQAASKCKLFGNDSRDPSVPNSPTNQETLGKEFNDLLAVCALLNEYFTPKEYSFLEIDDLHVDNKCIKLKEQFSQVNHLRMKGNQ